MAKAGRPKKKNQVTNKVTEKKINNKPLKTINVSSEPEKSEVIDNKTETESVSIIVPTAEPVNNDIIKEEVSEVSKTEDIVIDEISKPEEVIVEEKKLDSSDVKKENSEAFVYDLLQTNPQFKKPVSTSNVNNTKKDTKPLEYPTSTIPIIRKLRKNPAYTHLTDAVLLNIASFKLRSRYFFS